MPKKCVSVASSDHIVCAVRGERAHKRARSVKAFSEACVWFVRYSERAGEQTGRGHGVASQPDQPRPEVAGSER